MCDGIEVDVVLRSGDSLADVSEEDFGDLDLAAEGQAGRRR